MGRSDIVGAAIVLSWVSVLGALLLLERGAAPGPAHDDRPVGELRPRAGAPLPEDHASFDVRRGKELVGRFTADQGRIKKVAAATAPEGAVWFLKRALTLDVGRVDLPPAALVAAGGARPHTGATISTTLDATLADDLSPVTFRVDAGTATGALLSATGTLSGTVARIELHIGEATEEVSVPLSSRPLLEEAAMPLLAAAGALVAGNRFHLGTIDPQTGRPDTILIEVVGPEIVALGEGMVLSGVKVLRDADGPAPRAIWVDPEGRVLREELPLGLVAVRSSPPAGWVRP